jgi:protein TonB
VAAAVLVGCFFSLTGVWAEEEAVMRVSEKDMRKAAIKKIEPEYPAMARQVRLSGQVTLDVLIDTSGNVEKVNVVRGNVLLSNSAASALKKWRFTPFLGAGNKPSRALASVTFDFRLQSGF